MLKVSQTAHCVLCCRTFQSTARSSTWWRASRSTESSTWFTGDCSRVKTFSDDEWVSHYRPVCNLSAEIKS